MDGLQPLVISAGIYSSYDHHPDWTESPPRVVSNYEMDLFLENSGVAYVNGQECPIQPGVVLLARPGDVRRNKLHFRCRYIHFSTDDPLLRQLIDGIPRLFKLEDSAPFLTLFKNVADAFKANDRFSRVLSAGRLCELLWNLHAVCPAQESVSKHLRVRKALRLIRSSYDEPLTVEQLAQACNMSTSYFHKIFVETTGTAPNRYLVLTRLSAAKTMLRDSSHSVAQVAESCGFTSQAYFCECMKKYTGLSPRQFRLLAGNPEKDQEELL